jgi:hypothetical protein
MEWEMSAYFVSAETIADAAYALKVDLDDKEMEPDCIAAHDLDSLGRVLWQLNALALWELYGDREPLGANFGIIATYTPEARPEASPNAWQRLKSLQCLIYQCAEGTVPSTDLFKVMEHVENVMAMQLTLIPRISEAKKRLETMPEYAKASWGRG